MALAQHNRLRASRDFSRVYRKGKRAATTNLALRALKQSAGQRKPSSRKPNSQKPSKRVDGVPSAPLLCVDADQALQPEGPRFGISISRKVSKRAVVRNRIKRQLKAIIRQRYLGINAQWQLVIVVRPPAVECGFDDFLRELEYLLQKLAIQ